MNQYNNKMNALEKLLKAKELFKKEMALRDEALEALQEYNRGKCRDRRLWDRYIELSKAADLKQKEAAEELK